MSKTLVFLALFASTLAAAKSAFITTTPKGFLLNGAPYTFVGSNFWYGANLGADLISGDRERLIRELNRLSALGVTNLRILAVSEGPSTEPWRIVKATQNQPGLLDETLMRGLDFLLAEMGKRQMKAVVVLTNFWPWSGGFAQYVRWFGGGPIPYPPPAEGGSWRTFQNYAGEFYLNTGARQTFQKIVDQVVSRTNTVTREKYINDPSIMAWELCNEPRGNKYPEKLNQWIHETAQRIKKIDVNHLVTTGSEGQTPFLVGNNFTNNHKSEFIDYTTIHIWAENWGWYDPAKPDTFGSAVQAMKNYLVMHLKLSEALKKPMVVEEFGFPRDNRSLSPLSNTSSRDRYYRELFQFAQQLINSGRGLGGVNFWSWAGEGRPVSGQLFWKAGDPFTGDPPHEEQGWLGVYDADESTKDVIRSFSGNLQRPRE